MVRNNLFIMLLTVNLFVLRTCLSLHLLSSSIYINIYLNVCLLSVFLAFFGSLQYFRHVFGLNNYALILENLLCIQRLIIITYEVCLLLK